MVNMAMMFVMFGGIMVLTLRQNKDKEEDAAAEERSKANEPRDAAFNPYREAKRTGKSVDEVMAEQAAREEKLAKKRARRNKKKNTEAAADKKIENCAEYLNNVYHVHAPAPISKEDRSVTALNRMRKEASRAEKAAQEAKYKKKKNS